jgi:hypothetical protein
MATTSQKNLLAMLNATPGPLRIQASKSNMALTVAALETPPRRTDTFGTTSTPLPTAADNDCRVLTRSVA